jgi:hypothetical protein
MRRTGGFRVWAIMWAVLQLALPPAATIADARLERESEALGETHVESSSLATCRPVHAAECALCQIVSSAAAPSERAPCPPVTPAVTRPPAAAPSASATSALSHLPPARAPPIG